MRTHYRIDDFQEVYFVLDHLQDLLALAKTEFAPYYSDWTAVRPTSPVRC
jgi:phenylalanine-4-hydroxylase